MAFVNIMVHAVWGTKNRYPFLKKEIRPVVHEHIKQNAVSKQIFIDCINGVEDHIHVLLGLNADMSIAKTIQLIKGEASFWINKQKMTNPSFEWADEYYAVSVSESLLNKVREYISKQEEHHRKKTFQEECDEFMKRYEFLKFQG
ncbi:MAG TPA: IS200/IS605 family transposase [Chitinophagaceae bacterium]|nr:IS200/IS605 family transposase [Chitinophagaceae bacterium]